MENIGYSGLDNLEVMREAKNYNSHLLSIILSIANKKDTIVDFGAGNGTFALPIRGEGYSIICIEKDTTLYMELKKQKIKLMKDIEQIEDDSIDYIYSLNVIEHIQDDVAIIKCLYRKLHKNGKLMVYVPAFKCLFSSMDKKVGHIRRYSKYKLCHKLKKAGFDIMDSRYADSLGFFASIFYKVFDRQNGLINLKMLKIYDRYFFPLSKIMDIFFHPILGKNIYAFAIKSSSNNKLN